MQQSTRQQSTPQQETLPAGMQQREWHERRQQLEEKKAQIYAEIQAYPFPIPACDQHYNYLLEERTRIRRELRALERQQLRTFHSPR